MLMHTRGAYYCTYIAAWNSGVYCILIVRYFLETVWNYHYVCMVISVTAVKWVNINTDEAVINSFLKKGLNVAKLTGPDMFLSSPGYLNCYQF